MQAASPVRTLRLLGIALRDLHNELLLALAIAEREWMDKEPSEARNEALNRQGEALERCEVLLISVFTLLRRLGDDLINGLRPILFEHWQNAPRKLPDAVKLSEAGNLAQLKPCCDPDALANVLLTQTSWLAVLRKESGIRDILVHKPHILTVGPVGERPQNSERTAWRIRANLTIPTNAGMQVRDVLPPLLQCIAGACAFMTSLSRLVGGAVDYGRGDRMTLCGADNSSVGFWPAIRGGRFEFPLPE